MCAAVDDCIASPPPSKDRQKNSLQKRDVVEPEIRRRAARLLLPPASRQLWLAVSINQAMSAPEYGPHRPTSPSQQRQQRNTLVPSGFECVAHPVFFRVSELSTPSSSSTAAPPPAASATTAAAERRRRDASATPTTTISQAAAAAWDVETLGKGGNVGADDLRGAEGKGAGEVDRGEEREVDAVCPICLGKFERPVTLTSCLHSFCHAW